MIRILVTGSKGQLGSEFQRIANLYQDYEFTFTDIDELDITDFECVRKFIGNETFDYCINCAGYTAVDKAEDEVEKAFLLNAYAVENLAKGCEEFNVRLIHISTDYVFNGNASKPYKETDAVSPQSVYGHSKLKGEEAVISSSKKAIIIRTAWLCSIFGNNFVKTMLKLGAERDQIKVVHDQLGSPTFSNDLAKAIMQMILSESGNTDNEIYHYSSLGEISWFTFAKQIMEMAKLECEVEPIGTQDFPTKAKRPAYSVLNKGKIIQDYHLKIPDWKESLLTLIKELRNIKS